MRANKGKDTSIELLLRRELHARGRRYRIHERGLPGCPDVVFPKQRLAVFVDGDFWHGYRLPVWEHELSEFWSTKLRRNKARDARNHRLLRRRGWTVMRIWEHQIHANVEACADRIESLLDR